jgi:hydroxymethylbilane synthase
MKESPRRRGSRPPGRPRPILRLGTRSSRLALWQARKVSALLSGHGIACEIVSIETRGDDITDRPLPEIGGEGVFTERIERSLRSSDIDIAVHSLKDLPVEDPDELCVGAILGREEAREVLVSREGRGLAALPRGAVIGSSSTRRQAQLLTLRPDLVIRPIRGNVETRIRKVETGEYDATVLAGAGVLRLGLQGKIAEWLRLPDLLPAPGQGAIAVQCRAADAATRDALALIDEPALHAETDAERGFLRALGGGCSAPVGAFAATVGTRLRLHGRVSALDGSRTVDVEKEGEDSTALVAACAAQALREGAAELIAQAHAASPPPAESPLRGLRVLVTRPREQAEELCRILDAAGAVPVTLPLIRIVPLEDTGELDAAILRLSSYRWLVFTSANGVACFVERLYAAGQGGRPWPDVPRVAAVGPGTVAALSRRGISVDFVPNVHTAAALAEGIILDAGSDLSGVRVLVPRALHGREDAAELLRRQGAAVEEVPLYRTEPLPLSSADVARFGDGVHAIFFASGSAVDSWCRLPDPGGVLAAAARRAVIVCIGPATAAAARGKGLRVDVEAAVHTAEGMVAALGRHMSPARGRAGDPAPDTARGGTS